MWLLASYGSLGDIVKICCAFAIVSFEIYSSSLRDHFPSYTYLGNEIYDERIKRFPAGFKAKGLVSRAVAVHLVCPDI